MKYTFLFAIAFSALASCSDIGNNNNGSASDSTNSTAAGDTSMAVPDSVTGGSGYMSSGNTASGNSNAGSLHTDTLPMGAGRNKMPDSIKEKVLNQKGDTATNAAKHHD